MVKNPPAMQETQVPRLGRSPGEGNGYPLQYSGLEISMDRGVWRATVHGVTKSQTRLRHIFLCLNATCISFSVNCLKTSIFQSVHGSEYNSKI